MSEPIVAVDPEGTLYLTCPVCGERYKRCHRLRDDGSFRESTRSFWVCGRRCLAPITQTDFKRYVYRAHHPLSDITHTQ